MFLASIIGGSFLSVAMHEAPFIGAGASGGVSGLLGALMGLWFLRRIGVPASFFVINIGLNIAVALFAPNVDWQAHLGGFLTGMVLALVLAPRPGWRDQA
jgi:membrane associated rhomboid family serine protease